MVQFVLALVLLQGPSPIERDAYGVPNVYASTWEDGFYYAGYAVAQDRLWQMESSRRIARGHMAEVFGPAYAPSDRETLTTGYTDEELQQQFDGMGAHSRGALTQYAKGVNAYIADAEKSGKLPPGYAEHGFTPAPWSVLDSVAITIRLFHLFGRGGEGGLRNLAALGYLQTQACKDKVMDVIDDFAWQNDPVSPTTVAEGDDPLAQTHPKFPRFTREGTLKQLAALPKLNLFELLPAIQLARKAETKRVAQAANVPFRTGSYAIAVSKGRSATGTPLLLSGPQMGFTTPSIAHEMSISAPGVSVAGMDVPGIPGVLIGYTPRIAWGLTSGIADTEDTFCFKADGADGYLYGTEHKKLETIQRTLKVKGAPDQTVTQTRTMWGPVILSTKSGGGYYFATRATYWMKEMHAYGVLMKLYEASDPKDVFAFAGRSPVSFNILFATTKGDIGYAYMGSVPLRAEGMDPRFPAIASPATDWQGIIPFDSMPHAVNPAGGLFYNWNNKPATWWPNLDTPVWGRIHEVETLAAALDKPKLGVPDLEAAAWRIARLDYTAPHFVPLFASALAAEKLDGIEADAAAYLKAYDGRAVDGSSGATIFDAAMDQVRLQLIGKWTGNFMSPDIFRVVAQPSLLLNALEGKTAYDYLQGRKKEEVLVSAFKAAVADLKTKRGADPALWRYSAPGISVPGEAPIPYSNRGAYIQIVEVRTVPRGRNVLPPGVAESGPHSLDQVPLARAWLYKPMHIRPGDE
jgi:penicillin amidase